MANYTENPFGVKNDKRELVEIKPLKPKEKQAYHYDLNKKTVDQLMSMAEPYLRIIDKYRFYYIDKEGRQQPVPEIEAIRNNDRKLKRDWVAFLALFVSGINADVLTRNLSNQCDLLLRRILENYYVPEDEAKILFGGEIYEPFSRNNWYFKKKFNKTLQPLVVEQYGYLRGDNYLFEHTHYLYFKEKPLYRSLLEKLMPEMSIPEGCSELPEEAASLKRYDCEGRIFSLLPALDALYDSNKIEIGEKKMSVTVVRKAAKLISLPEFYEQSDKVPDYLALTYLLGAYCIYRDNFRTAITPEDVVATILMSLYDNEGQMPYILLPHIKGFKAKFMENNKSEKAIVHINATLKKYHDRGWIDIEKLCYQTRAVTPDANRDCLIFPSDFDNFGFESAFQKYPLTLNDIVTNISYPFIKAYLSMLATIGVVELAYDDSTEAMTHSYFDGMKYVKLTDLGKYALDITNKYERKKGETIQYFEIDSNSLVITSLVEDNPYVNILDRLATRISANMFRVSCASFLSNCEKKSDVEYNIGLFRKYVCDKPSDNWESFFASLIDKCTPLKGPSTRYSQLQLPTENKELQRIFATDPELREYILKAEKYIVLVETDKKTKVQAILKKYGYII